jgi:methylated-DNA-[protein]-cysteine S-methyltransferase
MKKMKSKIIKSTPFGPIAILWSIINDNPHINLILISKPGYSAVKQVAHTYSEVMPSSCMEIDAVASQIRAFLKGEDINFSLDLVNLDACPPFQEAVLRAEHRIPRGSVSTYKLIATQVGNHQAARAVGNALANNPFPLIVPCHRAIRSDGHLGGFQGGFHMKKVLLENEGVKTDEKGRVINPSWYYKVD